MDFLKKLITARAALVTFIVAALVLVRTFGIQIPNDYDDKIGHFVDSGIMLLGLFFGGGMLHNADPPAKKDAAS